MVVRLLNHIYQNGAPATYQHVDHHTIFKIVWCFNRVRNGSEHLKKAIFCVRNGSATPREGGFAEQTQVMLLGQWWVEDVT